MPPVRSVPTPPDKLATPAPGDLRQVLEHDGADPDGYGWDWSATTHQGSTGVVDDLLEALAPYFVIPGKGLQGWSQSLVAFDAGGYKTGAVFFGGRDDVHVLSSSSAAHETRSAVVGIAEARTARVDTRVDTLIPFGDLRGLCSVIAGAQTKVTYMESHQGGQSTGRTLYVGAPSSAVRVRVYEKWLESPGQYVEGTNRVEVQLRPPSRGKGKVSTWAPAETFCASKLTRRLAEALGTDVARPGTLQKAKGVPDLERSLAAMGDQYGNSVRKWLSLSGGDLSRVLEHLAGDADAGTVDPV